MRRMKHNGKNNIYLNEVDIERVVLSKFVNLTSYDLRASRSRKEEVRFPRQLCHYFGMLYGVSSSSRLGTYFGKRDHTTVLHSCKVIQRLRSLRFGNKKRELIEELDRALSSIVQCRKNNAEFDYYGLQSADVSPQTLYYQRPI